MFYGYLWQQDILKIRFKMALALYSVSKLIHRTHNLYYFAIDVRSYK